MAGKSKLFAKALGGKLLITAHAAVAGGKNTMGTSRLTIDEFPSSNASVCYSVSQTINNAQVVPDNLTVAIPPQTSAVKMVFTVGDVVDNVQGHVLFLVYSSTQTSQAEFTSTVSDYQLGLPLANIGVLGVYNLPAIQSQPQAPSAIGQADSNVKSKLVFNIDLDPAKIAALQASGGNQLFFQAGLIGQADLNAGILSNMILSEVDAITFINGSCPSGNASISADGQGGKTTRSSNNVSLSKSPTSTNVGGKVSTSGKTSSGTSGKSSGSSSGSSSGDSSGKSSSSSGGNTNTGGK